MPRSTGAGGRSVLAMLTDVERLDARGKIFQTVTQPDLHIGGSVGRLVLSIMAAFAEFERELIRERTREGMARARAEGKPIGSADRTGSHGGGGASMRFA